MAFVEGAAHPVGEGVGALALVVDDRLGHLDGGSRAVERQQERRGPCQQEEGAHRDQGARSDPAAAARARAVGGGARLAERLAAQSVEGGADTGRLAVLGEGDRPVQVTAADPAAFEEQLEQRALHGDDEQGHGDRAEDQQGSRRRRARRRSRRRRSPVR